MRSRRRLIKVGDWATLRAAISEISPQTVFVDVEPLVVHWREPSDAIAHRIGEVLDQLLMETATMSVVFVTNARRFQMPTLDEVDADVSVVLRAHKPWRVRRYARMAAPAVVIGDMVLTDGLFAWRIGATYLSWTPGDNLPAGVRLMKAVAMPLECVLFTSESARRLPSRREGNDGP